MLLNCEFVDVVKSNPIVLCEYLYVFFLIPIILLSYIKVYGVKKYSREKLFIGSVPYVHFPNP